MTFISIRKLVIASCLIVVMSDGAIEEVEYLLEESFLARWDIKYLSVIGGVQQARHKGSSMDFDSHEMNLTSGKIKVERLRVNILWSHGVKTFGIDFLEGGILCFISNLKPPSYIDKLIARTSSSRPLFLYSLRNASLPTWLRTTHIPFTSNVYVILQDELQSGTLILQGVYHLHEESDQLTVDLVGKRMRQGSTARWTFFGPKYNVLRRADLSGLQIRTVIPLTLFDMSDRSFGAFHRDTEPIARLAIHAINASLVPVILEERVSIGLRNASGHWSGMVGMLQRREAEFSMINVAPSAAICEVIDMTFSYVSKVYHMYIRKPEFTYSLSTSFKGFAVPLWLTSIFVIIFLSIYTSVISMVEVRFFSTMSPQFDMSESVLYAIGSCCLQGWSRVSTSKSGYVICLTSALLGYVLNLYYVSQLQAAVTAKNVPLPFRDLEGLVNTPGYLPGIFPGTTPYVLAQSATSGTMARIKEMISKEAKRVLLPNLVVGLERMCTDNIAMITWKAAATTKILLKANCTIVDTKESIFPIFVSLGIAKGYPYKQLLDYFIRRIAEGGIVAHFTSGTIPENHDVAVFNPIELVDVIPFLVLYATAIAVAGALLFLEILFSSVKQWKLVNSEAGYSLIHF